MNSITIEEIHTVDDIAMDALVMDESSSLSWFSFRAKVDPNFELGRESYSGIACRINTRILNLEHTVNVTAVFTCLESNDNDPVNGVLSSLVTVNHMLEKHVFRKTDLEYAMTDLEYAVTDMEYSVDAHPFETNMKLQD